LNEASLVGIDIDDERRWVGVTLAVLTLPADGGPEPADPRVKLILSPVGRLAASLRHGKWDDIEAPVEPLELSRLPDAIAAFNQQPIYGWEFIDAPEKSAFKPWSKRLSLDWRPDAVDGQTHTLDLFQEWGAERHIDVRVWFDDLRVFDASLSEIPLGDFIAGGGRWWDAMHAGDKRTEGHGIAAIAPPSDETYDPTEEGQRA
jgi:hypothetical protein